MIVVLSCFETVLLFLILFVDQYDQGHNQHHPKPLFIFIECFSIYYNLLTVQLMSIFVIEVQEQMNAMPSAIGHRTMTIRTQSKCSFMC